MTPLETIILLTLGVGILVVAITEVVRYINRKVSATLHAVLDEQHKSSALFQNAVDVLRTADAMIPLVAAREATQAAERIVKATVSKAVDNALAEMEDDKPRWPLEINDFLRPSAMATYTDEEGDMVALRATMSDSDGEGDSILLEAVLNGNHTALCLTWREWDVMAGLVARIRNRSRFLNGADQCDSCPGRQVATCCRNMQPCVDCPASQCPGCTNQDGGACNLNSNLNSKPGENAANRSETPLFQGVDLNSNPNSNSAASDGQEGGYGDDTPDVQLTQVDLDDPVLDDIGFDATGSRLVDDLGYDDDDDDDEEFDEEFEREIGRLTTDYDAAHPASLPSDEPHVLNHPSGKFGFLIMPAADLARMGKANKIIVVKANPTVATADPCPVKPKPANCQGCRIPGGVPSCPNQNLPF
jgi:hypothetical protein